MKFSEYLQQVKAGGPRYLEETSIPHQAERYQGRPAGLVSRIIGSAVDAALVYVVVTALDLALRTLDLVATPFINMPLPTPGILLVVAFAIFWAYSTWAWSSLGRTLGDHVMGLRVVAEDGTSPRIKQAALRSLLVIAFPLGVLWVPFSRRRRSVQDALVRTQVLYDWVTAIPGSTTTGSQAGRSD